jgi:hypothetical protein
MFHVFSRNKGVAKHNYTIFNQLQHEKWAFLPISYLDKIKLLVFFAED